MNEIVSTDKFSRLPERYRRRAREISARVAEIDSLLVPAKEQAVRDAVVRMARQFREQPETDQATLGPEFKAACRDLPEWAVSEATNDFLAGRVDSHTGQFMPTCAEFAKRARQIILPFLAERASLRTEAEKLVERAADDHRRHLIAMERQDPEVRKRVSALVEDAIKGSAKPIAIPHVGLDHERQQRLDAMKKKRSFVSKIEQTRIVKGERG